MMMRRDSSTQTGGSTAMAPAARTRAINRVFWTVLLLNLTIAAVKFIVGSATGVNSMRADGIHSLFDSAGNIAGLVGMHFASRPADYDHPYGHGKFETYASAVIGLLLIVAAYDVASGAISNLMTGTGNPDVTLLSFAVMLGTLVVNLSATMLERRKAKEYNSEVLAADSRHTLSDVIVTIGVIIGLVLVRAGLTIADSIMSLVVAVAILVTAYDVFKQVNRTLSDEARIPQKLIAEHVSEIEGVRSCHHIRSRGSNSEVYLDLHVIVDPQMTVECAHELSDRVEARLHGVFPQVVDVLVHIEPDDTHQRAVTEREQDAES